MLSPERGSILLRRTRPSAARVHEENLDKEWDREQARLQARAVAAAAAVRERERWGHQHEFDREDMHQRLRVEREEHLAIKDEARRRAREQDMADAQLPGHFEDDFVADDELRAARREAARRAMEDNARLARAQREAARAQKLEEVATDAARGDEFLEKFSKPAWRDTVRQVRTTTGLSFSQGVVPGL